MTEREFWTAVNTIKMREAELVREGQKDEANKLFDARLAAVVDKDFAALRRLAG